MIQNESSWKAPDQTKRYLLEWKPEQLPRAVIVLVHGLGEHAGRYEHMADYFTKRGFVLLAFDLAGHGKSDGSRGDAKSFDEVCMDIDHMVDEARVRYPGLPVFIYGHSLGGGLTLYYGIQRSPDVAGMVVTAPSLETGKPLPRSKEILARTLARIAPSFLIDNGLDRSGLSRDPSVVERYNSDPRVHGKISAGFGVDAVDKGKWIAAQKEFPVPLLLMQGSADRVINPHIVRQFAAQLNGDVTFIVFEGFYHELHNEPEQLKVFETVSQWLDRQMNC